MFSHFECYAQLNLDIQRNEIPLLLEKINYGNTLEIRKLLFDASAGVAN